MGDRHYSVVANTEETGSTGNNKQVCKKKKTAVRKTAGEIWFRP
jgi:hypothetical protein